MVHKIVDVVSLLYIVLWEAWRGVRARSFGTAWMAWGRDIIFHPILLYREEGEKKHLDVFLL